MPRPLITVFGATGACRACSTTAGALVRALLAEDPGGRRDFRVRAVTRRPGSGAARELSDLGAEICAADIADSAALARALSGACGVFCCLDARHAAPLAAACSDSGPVVWAARDAAQARSVTAAFAVRRNVAPTVLLALPPAAAPGQGVGPGVVVASTDIPAAAAALFRHACLAWRAADPAHRGNPI